MNSLRAAKRSATATLAELARDHSRAAEDPRTERAFTELAEELERRVTGERKPVPAPRLDPDQLSLEDFLA
jgi:hypothetical protein